MEAFFHGVILAIGLILPLGVQNLFVFNQGIMQSTLLKALPVVVTASICDTILILLAVQGVSLFIASFSWIKVILLGIGFAFLMYMGWITWTSDIISENGKNSKKTSIQQQVYFAASVSLLNPHAVLDTIGVIGTSSIIYVDKEKLLFTIACILVSWCWFFFLAIIGRMIGKYKNFNDGMILMNKISAIFMWGAAFYMAYSGIVSTELS